LSSALYSLDTSALMDGMLRNYPPTVFPELWRRIDDLVTSGRFLVSEEVWLEARDHDDDLARWLKPRLDQIMIPTDDTVADEVRSILREHSRLVMNGRGRNRADPFVIAVARLRGATVVTGEGTDGTEARPKIPYICHSMDINCIRFLQILQSEGWTF